MLMTGGGPATAPLHTEYKNLCCCNVNSRQLQGTREGFMLRDKQYTMGSTI